MLKFASDDEAHPQAGSRSKPRFSPRRDCGCARGLPRWHLRPLCHSRARRPQAKGHPNKKFQGAERVSFAFGILVRPGQKALTHGCGVRGQRLPQRSVRPEIRAPLPRPRFSIHDCGFSARSALEVDDSGQARVLKILDIIEQSKYGIHDISRAGIDRHTGLARFNMPLELGFFLGAKRFGSAKHRQKRCLVLDRNRYRYRNFCSEIAGQDVRAHNDHPREAIRAVRDWLSTHRTAVQMPGGKAIFDRYERFRAQLAVQAADVHLDAEELTFGDYTKLVVGWLTKNPW